MLQGRRRCWDVILTVFHTARNTVGSRRDQFEDSCVVMAPLSVWCNRSTIPLGCEWYRKVRVCWMLNMVSSRISLVSNFQPLSVMMTSGTPKRAIHCEVTTTVTATCEPTYFRSCAWLFTWPAVRWTNTHVVHLSRSRKLYGILRRSFANLLELDCNNIIGSEQILSRFWYLRFALSDLLFKNKQHFQVRLAYFRTYNYYF